MGDINNFGNNFDKIAGSVGSAASAAGGVLGVLDGIFGWSAKRQERAQKRMMDKQQDQWKEQQEILAQQQLDQWNRENEYNDPTNYYKRLLQGADSNGISKAAVLGNTPSGSVGQSATGVSATGSTGSGLGSVSLSPIGSSLTLGNLKQRAEINYLDALSDQARAGADKSRSDITLNDFQKPILEKTASLLDEQILSEQSRRALTEAQEALTSLQVDNYQSITDAQLSETWARIAKLEIETANAEKEGKYIEEQAKANLEALKAQVAVSMSTIVLQKAQAELANQNAAYAFANTERLIIDNSTLGQRNQQTIEKMNKELKWYNYNQLKHLFSDIPAAVRDIAAAFKRQAPETITKNQGIPLSLVWEIIKKGK